MVSVSPFWPKSPQFNHLVVPSHLHALEQTLQIKSTQSCHKKDLQYWGDSHLPQGPIQWWQWSLMSPFGQNPPLFESSKAISMRWSRHVADQINSKSATGTSSTGTSTCPGTHPVVAVVLHEPAKIPQFNHLGRPKPSPCVGGRRCRSNPAQSCHRRTSSTGRLPPAPGTHPVVTVVSVSPFFAQIKSTIQSHLSMRWSRHW
jgi:hypothetical protein